MNFLNQAPIVNYYGRPQLFEHDGKYYFALDNYSGGDCVQVSETFATAFAAEFPMTEDDSDYYYSKDDIEGYSVKLKFGGAK